MRRLGLVLMVAVAAFAWGPAPRVLGAEPRIISGSNVSIADHPHQVRLRIQVGSVEFLCGGSIRDETHVITAAHCVANTLTGVPVPATAVTVYYGSAANPGGTPAAVSTVAVPPEYATDPSYDVALLTLSSPIDLSGPNAKAIRLADPRQAKEVGNAFVTGWGRTSNGSQSVSSSLKGVRVPLRTDATCEGFWDTDYVASRHVCASGGAATVNNPDTCNGDSGGPLAVDLDPSTSATDYVLLGLTSYGTRECGKQNAPAVYTYVQGTGIASFLEAADPRYVSSRFTGGNFEEGSAVSTAPSAPLPGVPAPTAPPAVATRDITRPTARIAKLTCTTRRRCRFRLRASDKGGRVARVSATVSRRVRKCGRRGDSRVCNTTTRRRKLTVTRSGAEFVATATLAGARYTLTLVATDAAGNRSKGVSRRFRVR